MKSIHVSPLAASSRVSSFAITLARVGGILREMFKFTGDGSGAAVPLILAAALCWGGIVANGTAASTNGLAKAKRTSPMLSLDRLLGGEFNGESLGLWHWREDGAGLLSLEPSKDAKGDTAGDRDIVFTDAATGVKETFVDAALLRPAGSVRSLSVQDFVFSAHQQHLLIFSNSRRVWRRETRGDYWVLDLHAHALHKLGGDAEPGELQFAKFSPDSQQVAYVYEHDLYSQSLDDLRITRLTSTGSKTRLNGVFDWVYEEELDLRDGFSWSPDSRQILYWETDSSRVREFTLIRNTDELYPTLTSFAYPKAGQENSSVGLSVVDIETGDTRSLSIPGDPRNHYIARAQWTSNATEVLVQQFNRIQNTNHVFIADSLSGVARNCYEETDSAWIENDNDARWINDGREVLWLSDRSGWRRLYALAPSSGSLRPLSDEGLDVISIAEIDSVHGWVYVIASPNHPAQRYLYRVPLSGRGVTERVSPAGSSGQHTYQISPGGEWAVHTFSSFSSPPTTDLIHLPDHRVVRSLRDNKSLRGIWDIIRKPRVMFTTVDIGVGVPLDAWVLKPPGFDERRRYPVLFHVYGEPHGQTVQDVWGGRTHLWHQFLAQQGYVVISVDNRGVMSPRGRKFRKSAHRQIGIQTAADQAAAVRALLKRWHFLDPNRVGIWGWSGGGSLSLNAIFQYPDVYAMAMSVAPVPDQRYYDTIYQERYMGLPSDDSEGYRLGSPITHASKLRGDLLIVHGTGDDNVHYQGTEALINELVANKKVFTMMAYPDRSHSISEGRNTSQHLYELLTRYLNDHLRNRMRP